MLFDKLLTVKQKKRINDQHLIDKMQKKYEYFGFPYNFILWNSK